MSLVRYSLNGFGQLELNQVAFRRDGRIEAQCKLSSSDFSSTVPAENGMLLAVDNVKREVRFVDDATLPIALNYTTEHMYDERHNALKDFALYPGEFYPRLGYLAVGDKFTTNCFCYDSEDFDDDDAVDSACTATALASAPVYAGAHTAASGTGAGCIKLFLAADKGDIVGPVLKVIKATTMPDGQKALKFQVLAD